MILYVSSWLESVRVSTSTGLSNSISKGKNNLLLDDLLQSIDDIMFDNSFVDQHIFDYYEPSDNKDDVDNDVPDEIIPHVHEFRDASRFSFVVSHDWVLSHKCMSGESELVIGQTFNSKNKLTNVVKRWHIAHLVEYWVKWSNSTFFQLQCVQAPNCKWYLHKGYHKRSYSFEITKLKGSHTCTSIFV